MEKKLNELINYQNDILNRLELDTTPTQLTEEIFSNIVVLSSLSIRDDRNISMILYKF